MPWGVAIDLADSELHTGKVIYFIPKKYYISLYNLLPWASDPNLNGQTLWLGCTSGHSG